MARRKVGLDYFELDCQMDEKVRLIQAEFGLKGFALVVKLYQKIYGEFGYYCEWNEDSSLLFMSENGVSSREEKNLIDEIVKACVRRGIFSEEIFKKYGVLTSVGVQKAYLAAVSRRENVELKKAYLLVSDGKIPDNAYINGENVDIKAENVCRNVQSRVEERRVDESIGEDTPPLPPLRGGNGDTAKKAKSRERTVYYPNDEKLNEAFIDFVKMRKSTGKPITSNRAITRAMNRLQKLAGNDNDLAIQIIDQSIFHCWQDFYELKAEYKNKNPAEQKKNLYDEWRDA